MKALLGFFKKFRAGLITHAVLLLLLLLLPWAGYYFGGTIKKEGEVLGFILLFTIMGLLVFDFISIFIAASITARADAKGKPAPKSSDFFLGFSVSGALLLIVHAAMYLVLRTASH